MHRLLEEDPAIATPGQDRELGELCAENLGLGVGVLADELRLARDVRRAINEVQRLYDQVVAPPAGGLLGRLGWGKGEAPADDAAAPRRALLPPFTLLAGEILRLWQPLAPLPEAGRPTSPDPAALERCQAAWRRLRHAGQELATGDPAKARRELARLAADLPRLVSGAHRVAPDTLVGDALCSHGGAWEVFARLELACRACAVAPRHTLADAALCHGFDLERLLADLRALG